MSKTNPRKAVSALIPSPIRIAGTDLEVRPMTLGMFAMLERINSPIVTGEEPENVIDWLPTLYLLTHDPREGFEPDIIDRAIAWADTMPVSVVDAIRTAAFRQVGVYSDVVPEDNTPDPKKKRRTEDSPISRNGLAKRITGGLRMFFGRFRSRRSASSSGSRD